MAKKYKYKTAWVSSDEGWLGVAEACNTGTQYGGRVVTAVQLMKPSGGQGNPTGSMGIGILIEEKIEG